MNEYIVKHSVETYYVSNAATGQRVPNDYDLYTVIAPGGKVAESYSSLDYLSEAKEEAEKLANQLNAPILKEALSTTQLALQAANQKLTEARQAIRLSLPQITGETLRQAKMYGDWGFVENVAILLQRVLDSQTVVTTTPEESSKSNE